MNRRPLAIAIVIVFAVVVALVILLLTGGGSPESGGDDTGGDVVVDDGPQAPRQTDVADIQDASITVEGEELTFTAVMGADVETPEEGSSEWRWEIQEGGIQTWILSANVALQPTAHLIATQKDYSASTIDDSLPGGVSIEGNTVTVTLQVDDIEGFPGTFQWNLQTTLDASREAARSATARDRAPDEGTFEFRGD